MHEKNEHRGFANWAGGIGGAGRYPVRVMVAAGLLAVAAGVVSVRQLDFELNHHVLLAEMFNEIEALPGQDDLYVVVDTYDQAGQPNAAVADRAKKWVVEKLSPALQDDPLIEKVVWGFDRDAAHPKILRLAAEEEFETQLAQIEQATLLLANPTPAMLLRDCLQQGLGSHEADPLPAYQVDWIVGLMGALKERLTVHPYRPIDFFQATSGVSDAARWHCMTSTNGRLLLIRVMPVLQNDARNPHAPAITRIREILDQHRQANTEISFGLTGAAVIAFDEAAAIKRDVKIVAVIAVMLIAILWIVAFDSVRLPWVMLVSLSAALGLALGWVTLVVGQQPVVSLMLAAMLLWFGVARVIHCASSIDRPHVHRTWASGAGIISGVIPGAGVVPGAVVFGVIFFTDFFSIASMGVIVWAGGLLSLLVIGGLFSVLQRWAKRSDKSSSASGRSIYFYRDRWVMPFARRPRTTLLSGAIVLALLWSAAGQARLDNDLLALMPRTLPSLIWQEKIIHDGGQPIYTGISLVDSLEQADTLAQQYRLLATVDSVGGICHLLRPDAEARRVRVRDLRHKIEQTRPRPVEGMVQPVMMQLTGLKHLIPAIIASGRSPALEPKLLKINIAINEVLDANESLNSRQRKTRVEALQRDFEQWQSRTRRYLRLVLDTSTITVEDVSPDVFEPYLVHTEHGQKYVIEITPKTSGDESMTGPLDPHFLGPFIRDLQSVDPNVAGIIVQVQDSSRRMQRAYLFAGVTALLVAWVLVWIRFRSITDATLAMLPVAVGLTATVGVMTLLGMSIYLVNVMVILPMMFSIGMDHSMHMLDRYRQNPTGRPLGLTHGTGQAITLTSCTAMIAFGAMTFASHRGISQLGLVLAIGVALTLLSCWAIMPAVLELRQQAVDRRRDNQPTPEPSAW